MLSLGMGKLEGAVISKDGKPVIAIVPYRRKGQTYLGVEALHDYQVDRSSIFMKEHPEYINDDVGNTLLVEKMVVKTIRVMKKIIDEIKRQS